MGFRINNNIAALTANANLGKSQNMMSRSIERLSSGLRINRGADDAAGLTISEKLRGQIRGLNRAITNAQDGISLIQTAEGALNEDAAIMNRLRELAIQAQDDALTTNDRLEIQKEVDQLVDEVDRIANTTEFNTKKLLDGTASAMVSTNGEGMEVYQTGNAGQMSAGDYKVRLSLKEAGTRQVQMSSILKDQESGRVAGLSSKLSELDSFYDNDGNAVLEVPQKITIRGNGKKSEVTISSDMTLEDMTSKIENAVTRSGQEGGLGLTGSTFAFNSQTGQVVFESGKEGTSGEIALASDEDVLKGLGFQITTESVAASYGVSSTQIGVPNPETRTSSTTTNRATGVVDGLDFKFELSSAARIDGTVAGQDSIKLGNTNIVFTIADTNSGTQQAAGTSATANVTVTLTAGRTFTTTSVTNIINNAVANAATSPGIRASFDGDDLQLTSTDSGSAATVSILANQPATDILGLRTGAASGSGGSAARLSGTTDVSSGITIGNQDLQMILRDGDGNLVPAATPVTFQCGSQVSSVSLTATFNNFFANNNVKAQASVSSSGNLEFVSTETGTDARISMAVLQGSSAPLGFINGQNATGSDGQAAVYTGNTNDSAKDVGWTFGGPMLLSIQDANGASSGAISISMNASGVGTGNQNFTMSKTSLTAAFDNSALRTTDVTYEFDAGNRLDFRSRSAGKDARVIMSTAAFAGAGSPTASNMVTNGVSSLGVNFRQAVQGSGEDEFNVHVTDRALNFQIGANQSQALKFEIVNTSADALGLTGLDITNVKSATRALGAIDRAVNTISSERSKLGSLQNRLNNTINNLTVTSTNLQATESKIRDVDVAKETVAFTRNQILVQAGTTQLAQAKALPQNALQLLQG